ncbi:uncharacterized protein N0V89_003682 [Didymosphaeria variabile]|uniref:C2H2-type domain-containing protein n=1 Tax=Didymosphaeria variabile TaxID=1932322 RepID=A0A9W9CCR7_9PLEO|nr:uncharacterized protein N0V89_003682 [Didymosphaeria variabile]KAJ4355662.1 hypothetical protein N0V89_003682 [Didymosphaeria variabile]
MGVDTDQDSELSDPPTDLLSEDGESKFNKHKGRPEASDLDQADFDTDLETDQATAADGFGEDSGYEAQNESEEDDERVEHVESLEDSEDEWLPFTRTTSSKATALPLKKTKKASKTKKDTKTNYTKHYLCPWPACGQRFGRKDHLKRHVDSHSETKSFRCPAPFCGHATKRKDNLKEHLKLRHNLSATAAARGVDQAARAAVAETHALAATVNAAIAAAERIRDAGSSRKVANGSGGMKKGRSGAATSSRKPKVATSSEGARQTGTGQQAAIDYEGQTKDENQSGAMNSNRGARVGSASNDDDDNNDIDERETVRRNMKRKRGESNEDIVGSKKARNGKDVAV